MQYAYRYICLLVNISIIKKKKVISQGYPICTICYCDCNMKTYSMHNKFSLHTCLYVLFYI